MLAGLALQMHVLGVLRGQGLQGEAVTLHLTWWWLWTALIIIYVLGLLIGLAMTMMADSLEWYVRPLILIWPLTLLCLFAWQFALWLVAMA